MKTGKSLERWLTAGLVACMLTSAAEAATFDKIVVFGDSLSDLGNDYIATSKAEPPAPYDDGRFSNGPLWIENVAAAYGLVLKPSLSGGTDYAFGGAETTADVSSSYGTIPSLYTQAANYLKASGGKADPKALYVVWGGSNDLLNTIESDPQDLPSLPNRFAKATKKIINLLRFAGATSFIVPQLPDIGKSPEAQALGESAAAAVSAAADALNLAQSLVLAEEAQNGVSVYHLHVFPLQDQLTTAAKLGATGTGQAYFNLTNTTAPCVVGTAVCADPGQYFYWDSLHPTAAIHALLGSAALAALPR